MEPRKVKKAEDSLLSSISYVKDLFMTPAPGGIAGKGIELGVGAALTKTVLKRLPVPLNFIAPIVIEKVILKYGVEEGREVLLKGLKWVKKATDDKTPFEPIFDK
jgi:hypothetical protein